jgi:hypothetical protein
MTAPATRWRLSNSQRGSGAAGQWKLLKRWFFVAMVAE